MSIIDIRKYTKVNIYIIIFYNDIKNCPILHEIQ